MQTGTSGPVNDAADLTIEGRVGQPIVEVNGLNRGKWPAYLANWYKSRSHALGWSLKVSFKDEPPEVLAQRERNAPARDLLYLCKKERETGKRYVDDGQEVFFCHQGKIDLNEMD